jgi:hypothetical protein
VVEKETREGKENEEEEVVEVGKRGDEEERDGTIHAAKIPNYLGI